MQKPYQRVKKDTVGTLDNKPSGGLNIPLSEDTKNMLNQISEQMDNPKMDAPVDTEESEDRLEDTFKDMLNPPAVTEASVKMRKAIEANLKPIDIDTLFMSGELKQRVPIIKGKFTVTFRTLKASEDLYIKRRLNDVKSEVVRYAEDRFLLMQLAAHISDINGVAFPEITDPKGDIVDDAFEERFKKVANLPLVLIQKLWVNWMWFQDRVNKSMNPDFLESGSSLQ
tara:strand:- start:708 stop:1385 length:678 start_codon:yes stop_codon:yes gene_type:complete